MLEILETPFVGVINSIGKYIVLNTVGEVSEVYVVTVFQSTLLHASPDVMFFNSTTNKYLNTHSVSEFRNSKSNAWFTSLAEGFYT